MPDDRNSKSNPETFIQHVSESIKATYDLTTRVDERVRIVTERVSEFEEKLEKIKDANSRNSARITILEKKQTPDDTRELSEKLAKISDRLTAIESGGSPSSKKALEELREALNAVNLDVRSLSHSSKNAEDRWNKFFDFAIKLGWAILAAYLLYKLGLPQPL